MKSTANTSNRVQEAIDKLFTKYHLLALEEQEAMEKGDTETLEDIDERRKLFRQMIIALAENREHAETMLNDLHSSCSSEKIRE
jgi:hypothetical protein